MLATPLENHYREQALLPALPPHFQAMVRSASGPAAGQWLATLPPEQRDDHVKRGLPGGIAPPPADAVGSRPADVSGPPLLVRAGSVRRPPGQLHPRRQCAAPRQTSRTSVAESVLRSWWPRGSPSFPPRSRAEGLIWWPVGFLGTGESRSLAMPLWPRRCMPTAIPGHGPLLKMARH